MDYLQYAISGCFSKILSPVLNLIINGLPSILIEVLQFICKPYVVLNLIINGLPSIPLPKG